MNKKVLHTVIDQHGLQFPDKLALREFSGKESTYSQLKGESDLIAKHLCQLDIGVEKVVGVFMSASIQYITSILGVNKSGNIFMPLAPNYPQQRLINLMQRVTPSCYITTDTDFQMLQSLIPVFSVPVLILDADGELSGIYLEETVLPIEKVIVEVSELPNVTGDQGNYMIYTSGSTGEPKILTGKHKSLSHFIHWEIEEFTLNESDRLTLLAPITFDVSLRDIFIPLVCGGTLAIPDPEEMKKPESLVNWIIEESITTLHIVPSMFRLITKYLADDLEKTTAIIDSLENILLAGEPLYFKDVFDWYQQVGLLCNLVNLYGPSETTLAKVFYRIPKVIHESLLEIVPLGNPITNTRVLILNEEGTICKIGEVGEICIKTPFRTLGYFGNDTLNKEKFRQNPIHNEHEDILYFTGDLGKYLEDRSIAFVGRTDSQIKIRGNRVELGEVEKTIMGLEGISQAVVISITRSSGDQALASYYTAEHTLDSKTIIKHIQRYLPDYMVPSFFIPLADFPLNINGKINRKALPKPQELLYESIEYVPPKSDLEIALAAIWSDVLNLKKVGVTNSFFELGGHSLNAVKAVSAISKQLGLKLALKDFFSYDSIRKQALQLEEVSSEAYVPINSIPTTTTYEVSPSQKRLLILNQLTPNLTAYNMLGSWYLSAKLDVQIFFKSLNSVVHCHESLRTIFLTIDGNFRQKILEVSGLECRLIDDKKYTEVALREEIEKESKHYFELSKGPLIRAKLFTTDTGYLFLLNMHHIITDGWSTAVFVKELLQNYQDLSNGRELRPYSSPIQYKEYTHWINERLRNGSLETQRQYWHQKLIGIEAACQIPLDFPRKEENDFVGEVVNFELDKKSSTALKELGKKQGVGLFATIQALLNLVLYLKSGNTKISIGSPVAGRNHPDTEDQIGMFLNYLVLLFDIDRSLSFSSFLNIVQQTIVDAVAHQEYPFDHLVEELKGNQMKDANPFYNALVVMNNEGLNIQKTDLISLQEELEMQPFKYTQKTSKLDITFFIMEGEELTFALEYNPKVIASETIKDYQELLIGLTAAVLENPASSLDQLCWKFSKESKTKVLKDKVEQLSEDF